MTQPTALFLADILEDAGKPADIAEKCAAELRRLHASCEDYAQHKQRQDQRILKLYAQRDALLEALKEIQDWTARATARAASAKVEENT